MPPQPRKRYVLGKKTSPHALWRFNQKIATLPAGKTLRLEVLAPARAHFSTDGWLNPHDSETKDTGLGVHSVDLPTANLPVGAAIYFTFFWKESASWEGKDFQVRVE